MTTHTTHINKIGIKLLNKLIPSLRIEPERYIGWPMLLADISLAQIHWFWNICYEYLFISNKFGFKEQVVLGDL